MLTRILGGLAAATALTLPATAQTLTTENVIALDDWNYDELYANGLSVDQMLDDADVFGPTGEEIGTVENVLIGTDGRVLSIIAQVGGFWDIGDTHINVPWDQVQVTSREAVAIPVTEDTVEDYSLYADDLVTAAEATGAVEEVDDDLATGPRVWRATELIGDYARLREDEGVGGYANYGYVNDIIIRDGEVAAVIVEPDVGWAGARGPYAYPYYGYGVGWQPGTAYYDLPYGRGDVENMEAFDYDRFGNEL